MSDGVVTYLPVWKKGASAEERFLELAHMARKHPERFERFLVIYQENSDDGITTREMYSDGVDTVIALGMIELGKNELLLRVRGIIE